MKKQIKLLIMFLFGSSLVSAQPLFFLAQSESNQKNNIVCEDKNIAGNIVKRCFYGDKPEYQRPPTPTIDIEIPDFKKPEAPIQKMPPAPRQNNSNEPSAYGRVIVNQELHRLSGVRRSKTPLGAIEVHPFKIEKDWRGSILITLVETVDDGTTSRYTIWISREPGGPPIDEGRVMRTSYLGGAIRITDPTGPHWALHLTEGTYYYNVRIEVHSAAHFIIMNKTDCTWISVMQCVVK